MDIERIIGEVLSEQLGVPKEKIRSTAYFARDLGVDGGDADDLIEGIRNHIKKDFVIDMDKYFHPEAIIHLRKVQDITIVDLARMITKQIA
ncbi:MAG: hypothetical protein R3F54_31940 [Alphaproteobacteria bacterium]